MNRLVDEPLYAGMGIEKKTAILKAKGFTIESFLTYKCPTRWFKTKNDVRKAFSRVYNVDFDIDYYGNLKECVTKSFFKSECAERAYNAMQIIKLSNVAINDEMVLEREYKDWRMGAHRLPSSRFDMWPRKFDGRAVLFLDELYRPRKYLPEQIINLKDRNDYASSVIRNGDVCLILQFCKTPFVLQMRTDVFMQCVDLDKLSERELHSLAWLLAWYFYEETKKTRQATTKREYGIDDIRWMDGRERITNFIIEKSAYFFELMARKVKRIK